MTKATGLRNTWMSAALVAAFAMSAGGAEVFVAPDGTPHSSGSRSNPIDIHTALGASGPARPGDIIVLLEGQYDGAIRGIERVPFIVSLSGSPNSPIIVRPDAGAFAHLNGTIEMTGSNIHLVNLDIGDLKWDVWQKTHKAPTALNVLRGENNKAINCNIFGGAMGSGIWTPALNFEMYGCIIHDFGYIPDNTRGSGHAVYTQNDEGTKTYRHNVFYRGAGWNFDIYTQQGQVRGFDVIENISFAAGYYKEGQVSFSYGLTGWKPASRIRFIGNVAYQPRDGEQYRGNLRIMGHYDVNLEHEDALVQDNYIMGAYRAFTIGRIKSATITGNTFWATGALGEIATAPSGSGITVEGADKPNRANYAIDRNTYYSNGNPRPFRYGAGHEAGTEEEMLTFAQWQALGWDAHGTMLPGRDGKPTGTKTFVFPNQHQPGRANVAVFNWDSESQVQVDLTGVLKHGQGYVIYNLLDVKQTLAAATPVVTGTFDGAAVALPFKADEASPHFNAYLVLPQ